MRRGPLRPRADHRRAGRGLPDVLCLAPPRPLGVRGVSARRLGEGAEEGGWVGAQGVRRAGRGAPEVGGRLNLQTGFPSAPRVGDSSRARARRWMGKAATETTVFQSESDPKISTVEFVDATLRLSPERDHVLGVTITNCWWLTNDVTGADQPTPPPGSDP